MSLENKNICRVVIRNMPLIDIMFEKRKLINWVYNYCRLNGSNDPKLTRKLTIGQYFALEEEGLV